MCKVFFSVFTRPHSRFGSLPQPPTTAHSPFLCSQGTLLASWVSERKEIAVNNFFLPPTPPPPLFQERRKEKRRQILTFPWPPFLLFSSGVIFRGHNWMCPKQRARETPLPIFRGGGKTIWESVVRRFFWILYDCMRAPAVRTSNITRDASRQLRERSDDDMEGNIYSILSLVSFRSYLIIIFVV